MKSHTFFKPESQRAENTVLALLGLVGLLAIVLAAMPLVVPPDGPGSAAISAPASELVQNPALHPLSRLEQLKADMRTLVAALRYLMDPEIESVGMG
jgi:hypothetical protein